MKKHTFIYLIAFCAGSLVISGYHAGAGSSGGYDCTGAETGLGNPAGCTAGCHTASTAITVAIELDSAGVPTTHYKGGMAYTVKITGTNTSTTSLSKFGLQLGSIKGSTALATPVNAGTWSTTCPAGTHYAAPQANNFVVGIVEQSSAIAATTGTGGSGTTYVKSFSWTAPVAGTGTISFWGAINAVNGDGNTSGDKTNSGHIVINEWGGNSTTGIANAGNPTSDFKISLFPNPATENIHLTYSLGKQCAVSVKMFDLNGRLISDFLNEIQNEGAQNLDASISNLSKGIYFVVLNVDGLKTAKRLVIQ
jgi:hypothetical protein